MDKTLCVDGLPEWVTEEDLRELCQAQGHVVTALIARDAEGLSMGYGFIEMATHIAAEGVVAAIDHNAIFGQMIFAARTYPVRRA
jgi:RNA recognition motif-containing protein